MVDMVMSSIRDQDPSAIAHRDKLSLEKETCKFRLHTKTKTKKFRTLYLLTASVMKTVSSVYAV